MPGKISPREKSSGPLRDWFKPTSFSRLILLWRLIFTGTERGIQNMKRSTLAAFLALAGSWLVGQEAKAFPPGVYPGIIFVANGSGDSTQVTENLCEVLSITKWPLRVDTTRWTSFGGPVRDHNDVVRHRTYGMRLACKVLAAQQACPGAKIYLIGHSSGTHVIFAT